VVGSGALKIGQAGEFDYSGTQALKALKEEGVSTVLVNPNIATIQTSHEFADSVYFLPVTTHFIETVIAAEHVDAILLAFGGQTALNCGLELERSGVLRRYGVRVLGTPVSTIETTEDRQLFIEALGQINVKTARSRAVSSPDDAVRGAVAIGFPVMVRAGYALGGQGSGIANNEAECLALARRALAGAPQVLIEECLAGWKEIEYEVVRDADDNCITVCNMENVDPMGIHTGESIVVAPSQTLNDEEYQNLRDLAIGVVRHLGVVGECNIQFAVNPRTWDYRVIEVNARLSRSSALASKATGYPLAYVAAKLAIGHRLPELRNAITKTTTAFFEPALDYIVCKIPRWDLQKFEGVEPTIGTEMKSVGEVMGIGRTFPEALQKALRMLDIGVDGLDPDAFDFPDVRQAIQAPSPRRIFAIARGLAEGMSPVEVSRLTGIDPFFLGEIARLVDIGRQVSDLRDGRPPSDEPVAAAIALAKRAGFSERTLAVLAEGMSPDEASRLTGIDSSLLGEIARLVDIGRTVSDRLHDRPPSDESVAAVIALAKRAGFSDRTLAARLGRTEVEVQDLRRRHGIVPRLAQIDTVAAEYPAETNYLHLTYGTEHHDVPPTTRKKILVLGSGPYRIGSSVEFDWCAVNAVTEARALGYDTLLLNCNPETVSTDYDVCDRLIFDEITLESILAICDVEQPDAVVVSMGGQTPNNLALALHQAGVRLLGTPATAIDIAESRDKFSAMLDRLRIEQPRWARVSAIANLDGLVDSLGGYPVLVRPSYVLSGAAMRVVWSADTLREYVEKATQLSPDHPVVISKFEVDALEIELDAVARDGELLLWAVSEHVEKAGVHSGDATLVFPAQGLSPRIIAEAREIGRMLARALLITGPFNVQLIVKQDALLVIECNLRASRSFPFVSKALGVNLIREATRAMLGASPSADLVENRFDPDYVAVKASQFSFDRLRGACPKLGVEMMSTGEVACFGDTKDEALLKAMLASGFRLPSKGALLLFDAFADTCSIAEEAARLKALGLAVYALPPTMASVPHVVGPREVRLEDGSAEKTLRNGLIDVVFSASGGSSGAREGSNLVLERLAIDLGIPVVGEAVLSRSVIRALASTPLKSLESKPWKHYLMRAPRGADRSLTPRTAGSDVTPGPLRIFIRQPFSQTTAREQAMVQSVLDLMRELNGRPHHLEFLTGDHAERSDTFRGRFELDTGRSFTPRIFRAARLKLLGRADAMIVIRTGLSESGAFELAYNIFGGNRVPVFFAIWKQTPFETTLLRDLDDLVIARYVTFADPMELREPLLEFLEGCVGSRRGGTQDVGLAHLNSENAHTAQKLEPIESCTKI
jgi:carbamoyl-phosphate synthase large subunit